MSKAIGYTCFEPEMFGDVAVVTFRRFSLGASHGIRQNWGPQWGFKRKKGEDGSGTRLQR